MRHALPILAVLAALAVGYLLLTGSDEGATGPDLEDDATSRDAAGAPAAGPLEAPGMATRDKPPPPKRRPPKTIDPRTIPRGRIDVLPVGPDLKPIPSRGLHVYVDATGRKDWARRLGRIDPETLAWSFPKILAGEVEIHVTGDHVIAKKQRAHVKADDTTEVTVHLDLAGAIQYDVVLYDKTRPKQVTLTLYDWQDRPVKAWYQERTLRGSSSPREARTVTQGPEGVVYGVLPGSYRLRAVSENEEWDDVEVDLVGGETTKVTFELRR